MEETLIGQVALLTGLSEDRIRNKFHQLALQNGKSPQQISDEGLREIMICLLQEVFASIKEGKDPEIEIN